MTDEPRSGAIRSGKLVGKGLWASILIVGLPMFCQQLFAACVGLFDKIIAGSLPDEVVVPAMDGLGVASYVGWLIGIAMSGLGIGGQAIIARAIGAGDRDLGQSALGHAVVLSLAWGALVGAALWLGAPALARLSVLSPEATSHCVDYVRILSYSMPCCALMMVGSMCLFGAGETLRPALIAVTVCVLNVASSWMLSGADLRWGGEVLVNPFEWDMHVRGIAMGTALSYGLGGVLMLGVLARGVQDLRLRAESLRPERGMTWRIARIGIPMFCDGIAMWSVNIFVLWFIGLVAARDAGADTGNGLQGAHIIAIQWEALSFMPGIAIGTAAGAIAGQYLGAGNPAMARRAILACMGIASLVMGAFGLMMAIWGERLTAIISTQPIHLTEAPRLLLICGVTQVFFAICMVLRQGLRGCGDTRWTFLITFVSSYGVRLPAAYLLGVTLGLGLEGIWLALCGEFVIRAALFLGRFLHGGWTRVRV